MNGTGEVGATIKARLADSGLTLRAAAKRTGISRSTLHRITNGQADPKLGQLSRLAEALDTTVDELLSGQERD